MSQYYIRQSVGQDFTRIVQVFAELRINLRHFKCVLPTVTDFASLTLQVSMVYSV